MKNKKIISITTVRNESDIIEEFVRYNCNILDEMYIIDNYSSDNTLNILKKLKDEGLPLKLFRHNSYAFQYPKLINYMQRLVRNEGKADFIMVLDSDDLIYANSKEELVRILMEEECECYSINEIRYSQSIEDLNNNLPFHKKFKYTSNLIQYPKVILNVNLLGNKKISINDGGHGVSYDNKVMNSKLIPYENVHLAHLDQRSNTQIRAKYIMGIITYLILDPSFVKENKRAYHWIRNYKKMIYEGHMKDIHPITAKKDEINNNIYFNRSLPLTCDIKYSNQVNINALQDCINIFNYCIEVNKDPENTGYLLDVLNGIDLRKSNSEETLIKLVKLFEEYIIINGFKGDMNVQITPV